MGCTPSSLSSAIVPDSARLSALKMKLPNAHITTYTYQPLVGMTSMTAPGGEVTTYEYDRFGRLLNVKIIAERVSNNMTIIIDLKNEEL